MTRIIVTNEDNEVEEFEFDADVPVITIGRRSNNDVCVPNLSVSGKHARITVDENSALIEDMNSTNGTYVNGRLISRQLLDQSDEIIIGKTRINVIFQTEKTANPDYQEEPANDSRADDLPNDDRVDLEEMQAYGKSKAPDSDDSFDADDSFLDDLDNGPGDSDHLMAVSDKSRTESGRSSQSTVGFQPAAARAIASGAATASSSTQAAMSETDAPVFQDVLDDSDIYDKGVVEFDQSASAAHAVDEAPHPLDGIDNDAAQKLTHELESSAKPVQSGAVIEIQNGAKSGQVLPIDKPVTTLGRPGIQIAAIMRKPDGYFLMHIESDDSVDRPTLNRDAIGDDPVLLHSGDKLNVAGIDVEFMLS